MRVQGRVLGLREFVPARFTLPENPIVPGLTGLADFVPAKFALPQQPSGIGEFVPARFALPQQPPGIGALTPASAMYVIPKNSVLQYYSEGGIHYDEGASGLSGLGCGCGCSGASDGCGGGCGGGLGDLSFSSVMSNLEAGDPTTLVMVGAGVLGLVWLLGRTGSTGSSYRAAKKQALAKLRAQYPTGAGRIRRAAEAF